MAQWHPFDPARFSFEFNEEKLAVHGISINEAAEVFWNGFEVRRNKVYRDRYLIVGQTDAGRRLKLVVQSKPNRAIRVITGWPL